MELHTLPFCSRPSHSRLSCNHFRATKLPPGPTGLPIFGNIFQLRPQIHESLTELAKLHGPLMTLQLGSITTIVSSSPETAKQILQKHDHNFSDRTVPDAVAAQPNTEATLGWLPADERWRNLRRIFNTHLFNNQTLDSYQHLRYKKIQQLVLHIENHCLLGTEVDIGHVAFVTMTNLISNLVFSIDMVDFDSGYGFKDMVRTLLTTTAKPNISDCFPMLKWFDLQGMRDIIRSTCRRFHEIIDDAIDKRLEDRGSGLSKNCDFLDVLLDLCEDKDGGFNRQTIKPIIIELYIGGIYTPSILTEWAMAELLHNPYLMQVARNEIIQKIGTSEQVRESDIDKLPFLQAIVKETLRLHPPAPLLMPHKAKNSIELFGFNIPKDSQVLINVWAIGRDEKYWENPLLFYPERFLESNVNFRGQDFELIPFGAGRRICPGLALGTQMVHLMLASIIQSFNWKLPDGTTSENLDLQEKFEGTLKKVVPLRAIPFTSS